MTEMGMQCVVLDMGSGSTKVGFAGEDAPHNVFPSVMAKSRGSDKSQYVGHDVHKAFKADTKLPMRYPVERGAPSDWDEYEKLWDYALRTELNVNPEEIALVLTDAPQNVQDATDQARIRRRLAEIAFESMGVCALTFGMQPVLSLFSTGRTRGCVVEVGAGVTSVVPIFEGLALKHAIVRQNVAGSDITRALLKSLNERKLPGLAKNDMMEVNMIKEKVCYVASDFAAEQQLYQHDSVSTGRDYELPDATTITVTNDRFECPEVLFQPHLGGNEDGLGLHELCLRAISKAGIQWLPWLIKCRWIRRSCGSECTRTLCSLEARLCSQGSMKE
eukprot:TRINITY_DN9896_c0_g1_i1.p1 TRINITY_DN9896_c0_g1~~TRINITY_DN9896_c0_g1_i1.p1  ORF type:complete len:332 (+),score=62.74 TRINITY_DN9896_c0_g1_i1:216-1211(+)